MTKKIGIYNEVFLDYLKKHLGEDSVIVKSKNIVCRCPWCELDDETKKHYHLYISTETPIFHCFYAGCGVSGSIKKLTKKISGLSSINNFVDPSTIIKHKDLNLNRNKELKNKKYIIPELKENNFLHKLLYLRQRFGFLNINLPSIKGLVFDIEKFIEINNIKLDDKQQNLLYFLQNNFIGFLSEHQSILTLRNTDPNSHFRHYKLQLQQPLLLDYYKINGNPSGNKIVLAEGIFDIFGEYLFNHLNIKQDIKMYVCGYSTSYESLLRSISFFENIYKPEVIILSDKDVKHWYYKKIKKTKHHLMSKISVFYNKYGKDFGDINCSPIQITI